MLQAQYDKCLHMLEETVTGYDPSLWFDSESYQSPAWQIAYHALFFTNIYCSATEDAIVAWPKLKPRFDRLAGVRDSSDSATLSAGAYSQADIREFLDFIRAQIPQYLEAFEPEEPCWPDWYDEPQLEFHLNNLRHTQHHNAELTERRNNVTNFRYRWY